MPTITTITTPGLGDNSFVVTHDGSAIVFDPQRDLARFRDALEESGAGLVAVLETHLHNDYVSGGRALAADLGADIVMPAASGAAFTHRPAFHLEDIAWGGMVVRPLHTPGHTPEHISYVLVIDGEVEAVFSGGSLLVGAVGRSDLLGLDRARSLARLQYASIHRLAELGDDVGLYPTHGAGSFCSASMAGTTTSTIGAEKASNPGLSVSSADEFVDVQLGGLQPYPAYYAHMGPINLSGPPPLPSSDVEALEVERLLELMEAGTPIVDARSKQSFAAAHIAGSWGIEAGTDFATWVGWLLPFDEPVALILEPDDDLDEQIAALARVGFDHVIGVMWGLEDWMNRGLATVSHETITARQLIELPEDSQILDVRAPDEWDDGHLENSIHVYLPDLASAIPDVIDRHLPVYVGCATGHRASTAAGILADAGYQPIVVLGASILGAVMLEQGALA